MYRVSRGTGRYLSSTGSLRIDREQGSVSGSVPRETGPAYCQGGHVPRETPSRRGMKTKTSAYVPRGTMRSPVIARLHGMFHVKQRLKFRIAAVYGRCGKRSNAMR